MKHLIRVLSVLCLVPLLALSLVTLVAAAPAEDLAVVYDEADHLTDAEENALTALADEYRKKIGDNHIIIVITDKVLTDRPIGTQGATSVEEEARKLGFTSRDDSCFLLLVSVAENSYNRKYSYATYTLGDMSRYISNARYNEIDLDEEIYNNIKHNRAVYTACERFIKLAGEEALQFSSRRTSRIISIVVASVMLGIVAGGVGMFLVWRAYRKKNRSASYPLNDFTRLYLTVERDSFVGRSVIRTLIAPKGGGRSGGGGFRGGGGGGRSGGVH